MEKKCQQTHYDFANSLLKYVAQKCYGENAWCFLTSVHIHKKHLIELSLILSACNIFLRTLLAFIEAT